MASIELVGMTGALRLVAPARIEAVVGQEINGFGDTVIDAVQVYPPELPNQRYRRTYALRGSWRKRRAGPTTMHIESMNVGYAPYVMGDGRQARIHQGRWNTDEQIARQYEPILQRRLIVAIGRTP